MSVETAISLSDQFAVEPLFAAARFISCDEEDRLPLRIKSKGHPPLAISRAEAQFFHVGVPRVIQRINSRPVQLRSELLKKPSQCQNLCPHVLLQRVELRLKLIANLNSPSHWQSMTCDSYDVYSIS